MAQLDRFLNLLVTNNGSSLNLAEGDVATVTIKDSARPVMKQVLTSAQILTLVREIAPSDKPHALDAKGGVRFEYTSVTGRSTLHSPKTVRWWRESNPRQSRRTVSNRPHPRRRLLSPRRLLP